MSQVFFLTASFSSLLTSSLITRIRAVFIRQVAFVDLAGSERLKKTQVSHDDTGLSLPTCKHSTVYIMRAARVARALYLDARVQIAGSSPVRHTYDLCE